VLDALPSATQQIVPCLKQNIFDLLKQPLTGPINVLVAVLYQPLCYKCSCKTCMLLARNCYLLHCMPVKQLLLRAALHLL
jgi:hypothetical protein